MVGSSSAEREETEHCNVVHVIEDSEEPQGVIRWHHHTVENIIHHVQGSSQSVHPGIVENEVGAIRN